MPEQPPTRDPDDRQRILDRISREQPEPAPPRDALPASPRAAPLDDNPILTLFCGGLFLYAGFFYYDLDVTYKSALMGASLLAFVWMARIVGFGLTACAVLAWTGRRIVLPLNFGLGVLAAAGCVYCGAVFLLNGYSQDGFLVLLFGLLNAAATRSAWFAWKGRPAT